MFLSSHTLWHTLTIRNIILGRPTSPGHCRDNRLKHDPSLPGKCLFTKPAALASGAGFKYPTHLEYGVACWEHKQDSIVVVNLSTIQQDLSEKSLYTYLGPWFLCVLHRRTSRSPGLEISRDHDCGPTSLYIFAYFKSCYLKVWLPISLKLGIKWNPSLWDNDRSLHTLSNKNLSINHALETITKVKETRKY